MSIQICPECNTTFSPASSRQLFCRPACAHRQRQRKYRQSTIGVTTSVASRVDQSRTDSHEATAALTALYEAALRKLRSADERKLASVTQSFEDRLATAYEQLNGRGQEVSRAKSKADELERSVHRLEHENTELLIRERKAVRDMQQLAVRVLALHGDANTRLDTTSAAIFARRGWNTEMRMS
jgi:hypothetical protein